MTMLPELSEVGFDRKAEIMNGTDVRFDALGPIDLLRMTDALRIIDLLQRIDVMIELSRMNRW
jgi:hypothetical protein